MEKKLAIRSDLLLLLTSIIWGLAFVFQRMGMEHVGPFMFNGIRFALGAGVLAVYYVFASGSLSKPFPGWGKREFGNGMALGLVLFVAASLQQVGIVYTTAGNAGFITGLYVIIVPILGMFFGFRTGLNTWTGAILAVIGMYFLSVTSGFTISPGDLLVLASAFFWAIHVILIGKYSPAGDALRLAILQNLACSVLSLAVALIFEHNNWQGIWQAAVPILYGGAISVGIGYTLQIIGQKKAPPAHAAIILSLEALFAVIGGTMILAEALPGRKVLGCILMLAGMIIAQLKLIRQGKAA